MRSVIVTYGLALLFSVALFAAPPPSVILSRYDAHPPVFISASAMVAADGTTAAVVPEDWRPSMQRLAEVLSKHRGQVSAFSLSSGAPCQGGMLAEESPQQLADASTLHSAIVNAKAIVAGTIRSVTPGFFSGSPGSLIELDNLDKIKTSALYNELRESLYLRLPYAQFVTGGIEYCRESGSGKYIPKVGDRLLVFAYGAPGDTAGTFVYATSDDVIAQPGDGVIRIPKSLSFFDNPAATIATVTTVIRSELSHRDRPVVGHDGRAQ
jgi:hypothetical protein